MFLALKRAVRSFFLLRACSGLADGQDHFASARLLAAGRGWKMCSTGTSACVLLDRGVRSTVWAQCFFFSFLCFFLQALGQQVRPVPDVRRLGCRADRWRLFLCASARVCWAGVHGGVFCWDGCVSDAGLPVCFSQTQNAKSPCARGGTAGVALFRLQRRKRGVRRRRKKQVSMMSHGPPRERRCFNA